MIRAAAFVSVVLPQLIADYSDRILLMNGGRHLRTYYPGDISIDALSSEVYRQNRASVPFLFSRIRTGRLKIEDMGIPWSPSTFNMELHKGEVLGFYDNESKFSSLFLEMLRAAGNIQQSFLPASNFVRSR